KTYTCIRKEIPIDRPIHDLPSLSQRVVDSLPIENLCEYCLFHAFRFFMKIFESSFGEYSVFEEMFISELKDKLIFCLVNLKVPLVTMKKFASYVKLRHNSNIMNVHLHCQGINEFEIEVSVAFHTLRDSKIYCARFFACYARCYARVGGHLDTSMPRMTAPVSRQATKYLATRSLGTRYRICARELTLDSMEI
ncbi:unnamed protein product, partial [Trichogramma brassicae]